jgi:hypothetical protein
MLTVLHRYSGSSRVNISGSGSDNSVGGTGTDGTGVSIGELNTDILRLNYVLCYRVYSRTLGGIII